MNKQQIIRLLQKNDLITGGETRLIPLSGGVSSDILLVECGEKRYVLKQALPQLKVKDLWEADTKRNLAEQAFIRFVEGFQPDAVPKMLAADPGIPCFVMEYLGPPFQTWKSQLLEGHFDPSTTRKAASLLASIHRYSYQDPEYERQFDTTDNFHQLRIEPYLITTGQRNPKLKELFDAEAVRLVQHREALVHGDFSPKNILVSPERLVLLDHEVAWYGDPAFDLAFFLNHLFLKMLLHTRNIASLPDLPLTAWRAYFAEMDLENRQALATRTSRLLLMLLLARVDGKSPVEYLNETQQTLIRQFVHRYLPSLQAKDFAYVHSQWKHSLFQHNTQ